MADSSPSELNQLRRENARLIGLLEAWMRGPHAPLRKGISHSIGLRPNWHLMPAASLRVTSKGQLTLRKELPSTLASSPVNGRMWRYFPADA